MHHSQSMPGTWWWRKSLCTCSARSRLRQLARPRSSRAQPRRARSPNWPPSGGNTPGCTLVVILLLISPTARQAPSPHQSPAHSVLESRRASGDATGSDRRHRVYSDDFGHSTLLFQVTELLVRTPGPFAFADGLPSYMEATRSAAEPYSATPAALRRCPRQSGVSTLALSGHSDFNRRCYSW